MIRLYLFLALAAFVFILSTLGIAAKVSVGVRTILEGE